MTATNTPKPAKDGNTTAFNLGMASESTSGYVTPKTYLGSPSTEALVEPAQDGTDGAGITPPVGGVGIRGWLSGIFNKLNTSIAVTGTFFPATQPVSAASLPLPAGAATAANQATAAQDGTNGTGITPPTGAAGIRGWLSGIFNKLNTSIAVTGTFFPTTQPVSGSVGSVGSTSIATGQVSIGTSPTLIVAARSGRLGVTIINKGTTEVDLGTSSVTTANGSPLPPVQWAAKTILTTAAIYGIVASGTQTVAFEELF